MDRILCFHFHIEISKYCLVQLPSVFFFFTHARFDFKVRFFVWLGLVEPSEPGVLLPNLLWTCFANNLFQIKAIFFIEFWNWYSRLVIQEKIRGMNRRSFHWHLPKRACTMSPEQSQYIWRKTISHIEVGMGSGVFTSIASARFGRWMKKKDEFHYESANSLINDNERISKKKCGKFSFDLK